MWKPAAEAYANATLIKLMRLCDNRQRLGTLPFICVIKDNGCPLPHYQNTWTTISACVVSRQCLFYSLHCQSLHNTEEALKAIDTQFTTSLKEGIHICSKCSMYALLMNQYMFHKTCDRCHPMIFWCTVSLWLYNVHQGSASSEMNVNEIYREGSIARQSVAFNAGPLKITQSDIHLAIFYRSTDAHPSSHPSSLISTGFFGEGGWTPAICPKNYVTPQIRSIGYFI